MSGRVGNAISKSGMVGNVGVAVEIASPSVSVQKLFPLPVFTSGFVADYQTSFEFLMSAVVVSAITESGVVENVGVAVGTASPSPSAHKLSLLLFSTCPFSTVKPTCWYFRSLETRGVEHSSR